MKIFALHENFIDHGKGDAIKRALRPWVVTNDVFEQMHSICRISLGRDQQWLIVQATVFDWQGNLCQQVVESAKVDLNGDGIMRSFLMVPLIIKALEQVKMQPSLIICDGKGLHQHYDFGLATHVGLLTNTATIGLSQLQKKTATKFEKMHTGQWRVDRSDTDMACAFLRVAASLPVMRVYAAHRICLRSAVKYLLTYQKKVDERWIRHQLQEQIRRLQSINRAVFQRPDNKTAH